MQFRIIEKKKLYGAAALQKNFFEPRKRAEKAKNKCPECGGRGVVFWDYDDPEVEATVKAHGPCPKCKGSGSLKEATVSGSGFPAAKDASGGQAIDKAPTRLDGVTKRPMKKKKNKQVAQLTNTFAKRLLNPINAIKK